MSRLHRAAYTAWNTDAEPFPDYLPYVTCVEDAVLLDRLFGFVRVERRPEIAGGHAVETISLRPETLAQSHRRQ